MPATFAHESDTLEACKRAHEADATEEERRALVDDLLARANLRVRMRPVANDELEKWLGHPVDAAYPGDVMTIDLDLQIVPVPFDVTFQRFELAMLDATPAFGPAYLTLLGVPSMPHEQRVRAQGTTQSDSSKAVYAIIGHAATAGVGIMMWWAVGGQARDLIPKTEVRKEPPLTTQEKQDIVDWAARRDVQAISRESGFRSLATMPGSEARPEDAIVGGKVRSFRNAFSARSAAALPDSGNADVLEVDLRLSVRDAASPAGRCALGTANIRLPLTRAIVRLENRDAPVPRRLPAVVADLAARGWITIPRETTVVH